MHNGWQTVQNYVIQLSPHEQQRCSSSLVFGGYSEKTERLTEEVGPIQKQEAKL